MELNSVVLPEPFGPISPTTLPRGTLRLIASLATTPPNALRTACSSSMGSSIPCHDPSGSVLSRQPQIHYPESTMLRTFASCLCAAAVSFSAPVHSQDVITFGSALSLTGKVSTEGRLVREGYDFYVRHINERGGIKVGGKTYKVAIKYYDDQSDPNTSAKLYEKLITEDGVQLLLGPYSSGITFAASAAAEKYQVPMVAAHAAATATFERGFRYIFATLTPVDQYTANM